MHQLHRCSCVTLRDINRKPDDAAEPFYVDLFVDAAGRVNAQVQNHGHWGMIEKDDVWPFILKPKAGSGEGLMDFGNTADDPINADERFAWTNIASKRITVGELTTVSYNGSDYTCSIVYAKHLPSGDDFIPIDADRIQ